VAWRALCCAGHNRLDFDEGRVRIEDGLLLAQDEEKLAKTLNWAGERLEKHMELERKRVEAKLPTDLSRWLNGERITD